MHIPQSMLHGNICPVTLTVSAVGVTAALYRCHKSRDIVPPLRWATVSALVFGLQMLNFPITNGTSGHLLGGILAVSLLGIPRAIVSLALVLLTQALFFGDGGMDAIGANVLNMSLIGAGLGGLLLNYLKRKGLSEKYALGAASLISVILATLACTIEVSSVGGISFVKMAKSMLPVHVLIGIGEAVLTIAVFSIMSVLFNAKEKLQITYSFAACVTVILLSPFASKLPDGLDWTASQLKLSYAGTTSSLAWFNEYQVAFIHNDHLSMITAGLIGAAFVWFCTVGMTKLRTVYDQK